MVDSDGIWNNGQPLSFYDNAQCQNLIKNFFLWQYHSDMVTELVLICKTNWMHIKNDIFYQYISHFLSIGHNMGVTIAPADLKKIASQGTWGVWNHSPTRVAFKYTKVQIQSWSRQVYLTLQVLHLF